MYHFKNSDMSIELRNLLERAGMFIYENLPDEPSECEKGKELIAEIDQALSEFDKSLPIPDCQDCKFKDVQLPFDEVCSECDEFHGKFEQKMLPGCNFISQCDEQDGTGKYCKSGGICEHKLSL
jgi:hypothetical protein